MANYDVGFIPNSMFDEMDGDAVFNDAMAVRIWEMDTANLIDSRLVVTSNIKYMPYRDHAEAEQAALEFNEKRKAVTDGDIAQGISFDWWSRGVFSTVRDQGLCGCCYAVAPADCIMAMEKIVHNISRNLSWQEIIDFCPWVNGCKDGHTRAAYMYVIHKPGLGALEDHPYRGVKSASPGPVPVSVVQIDSYLRVNYFSEENILKHLRVQPMSISMCWGPKIGGFKGQGIYEGESSSTLIAHKLGCPSMGEHSLLLIGFGTHLVEGDFWLLLNSHGEDAGDGGLYRVRRGGVTDVLFGKMVDGKRTGGLVTGTHIPIVRSAPSAAMSSVMDLLRDLRLDI